MSACARLAGLRRLADVAIGDDDPVVRAAGTRFARWLDGGPGTIEEALGIPDLAMLRVTAALEARDQAVRTLASRFGMGATAIYELLLEYERTRWPSDANGPSCPADLLGSALEQCWRILRARPNVPSARHIARIL